ncbi:epidermal growth factor receptor kinase substrate 8-like protein 3b isoform X3 [Esox lucius]|uniref:epidermal growth factor receptor kinase substrate 8-like protein 3b isoform X3 n=1 Tax=Esox lucius TaxID=8010 RepID=UPI00147746FB|nr:epidermal growth factor receptor kinase substrate 8-like protein 3b isoform X3 [Esox lucius]
MFGNRNVPFSYHLREDSPSQRSSMIRPSAKSIYMQRKEYSETMNNEPDDFQYRVEHLFTCELDGREVCNLDDCVARLRRLDAAGKVWGQEMILEVQRGHLQLNDIETKAELELVPLGYVVQTEAVLNSCAYDSLLTITVQERNRRTRQVFMFQCEEVGAEHISRELQRAIQVDHDAPHEPRREPARDRYDIRSNMDNNIGSGFQPIILPPMMPRERTPPPPDHPAPLYHRDRREYESHPPSPVNSPLQNPLHGQESFRGSQYRPRDQEPPQPQPSYTETERNVEILNHVLSDVEYFMGKVSAAISNEEQKKKKKKSSKQNAGNLPPWEELVSCLQKIKYGFNLLGKLNGEIQNPSAPDFVHILFTVLGVLESHYTLGQASSVLTPLLIEPALTLLWQVVTPEEERLWRALGDSWNIPRAQWPDGHMIPPYNPEFYDGWQPPMPVPPSANRSLSRSNSQHLPPREEIVQNWPDEGGLLSRNNSQYIQRPEEPMMKSQWDYQTSSRERPPVRMRVIYNFMARNQMELNIMRGEIVQVLDKSGQWWKVRNDHGEEGHVAKNVLEPLDGGEPCEDTQDVRSPPPLNMQSRPADVKAWLEYKGFSKITIRSLSVLNGALLLGMTKDEMRTVCPEEGGRVFFQLHAIKSSIALGSEPNGYGP